MAEIDNAVIENTINMMFVLFCGILCFLLQAGFGLLEVGSIREKNAKNIMLKNIMDAAVSALAYWAFGYGLAYGEGTSKFVGNSYFFMIDNEDYINWFFQWVFAGTVATIVSGAVAERCRFRAYLIYSIYLSGFVYPIVCHWIWDSDGFLYGNVLDYAGSGAVHLVGGAAAMSGAWILGPRIGKFTKDDISGKWVVNEIPGHNAVLAALGTLLLWFGFFPFNAGSGYSIAGDDALINTGRTVVVTTLAAASGAVTLLLFGLWKFNAWDPTFAMNGLLGGMVATCSGVNVYTTPVAVLIGILGAAGFYIQVWIFENILRIDDPLNASALHMGSGIIGMIAVGFLADPKYVDNDNDLAGIFYGGTGKQLGYQLYGTAVYFAWAFGTSSLLFYMLSIMGWLRVSEDVERQGMDTHHHNGAAYRYEDMDKTNATITTSTNNNNGVIGSSTVPTEGVNMDITSKYDDDDDDEDTERQEPPVDDDPAVAATTAATTGLRQRSTALPPGAS